MPAHMCRLCPAHVGGTMCRKKQRKKNMSVITNVAFTVPGNAVGKGRARATTVGGRARLYTPAKTVQYENLVALAAAGAMGEHEPIKTAVALEIDVVATPAASWSKKRKEAALSGFERPCVKPDADNILKAVADAMNGIVYLDDKQCVEASVSKTYGERAEVRVRVAVL